MAYPSFDRYNEAVQNPGTAFIDPVLKAGKVETNGFGIPIALGGGFALTYALKSGTRKFAVRCFHKQVADLERRYARISSGLAAVSSPYFVGFEYQQTGIKVAGATYPIVKMDWSTGETLGVWLERHFRDRAAITGLAAAFRSLESHLRSRGIAHGDIQNGNVLVKADGTIQLIDYDGLFVQGLAPGEGTEVGHKHFQHPRRSSADFGPTMDRFSFIAVDLSLRALAEKPDLFTRYGNGENILFSASDYLDASSSAVFNDMRAIPALAQYIDNFARVCAAEPAGAPHLEDFLAGRNIPVASAIVAVAGKAPIKAGQTIYVGAYDVIDASDYVAALRRVGDKVELIGKIVEIKPGIARNRKPYVFVNFGPWKGRTLKLNIWSEGLANLTAKPDESWVGKWVSVVGLIEAPYESKKYGYSHIGITIEGPSQYRFISEEEGKRRLRAPKTPASVSNNRAALAAITGNAEFTQPKSPIPKNAPTSRVPPTPAPPGPKSNKDILASIQASRQVQSTPVPPPPTGYRATHQPSWNPNYQAPPVISTQPAPSGPSKEAGPPKLLYVVIFIFIAAMIAKCGGG